MRIAEIHVYAKTLPIIGGPYTMAGTSLGAVDSTIVKIVSETGLVGWGETCPLGATYQAQHALGARAVLQIISPGLIGENALLPLNILRKCDSLLNGHHYAKAAIDIAVMDLSGQHYKTRVCDLLGGATGEDVPSYYALGIGSPEDTAATALEKVAQGYKRLQLKIGGRPIQEDIEVIHHVWEAVGYTARLAADANRGLTAKDTLLLSAACKDIPIIIEQPCNTLEEIAAIKSQISHPIYLDENADSLNDVLRAVELRACDGFGFKLTRLGGFQSFIAVRDVCAARSLPHSCDDSWGGDIIAAACTHMGATVAPTLLEGVWIAASYIEEHYDKQNPIAVVNGRIKVPTGFGLGLTLDPEQFGSPVLSFD